MKEQTICSFAATEAVLAANNVADVDSKGVQTVAQAIQASLRNHTGGGVQQVGEGVPGQILWRKTRRLGARSVVTFDRRCGLGHDPDDER
jgi:hypothetical protein